jgi:DNA ligase (NAD+)
MDAGFNTMAQILAMKYEDFLAVNGFKEKMAMKVYNGIRTAIENIDLPTFMAATNIFGRGLGAKKMKIIFDNTPDILDKKYDKINTTNGNGFGNTIRYNLITGMVGLSNKSASMFVDYLDKFNDFIQKSNLTHICRQTSSIVDPESPFCGKKIVFTGCRNKELEKYLCLNGANLGTSISKNTDVLVYKNKSGRKFEKARALGIKTHQFDEFKALVMKG